MNFVDFTALGKFFTKYLVTCACEEHLCIKPHPTSLDALSLQNFFHEMLPRDVSRKFFVVKVFRYTVCTSNTLFMCCETVCVCVCVCVHVCVCVCVTL